jgi:hypothetical protein
VSARTETQEAAPARVGRFDEAILAGKKAQRQNPSYPTAYRISRLLSPIEARETASEGDPGLYDYDVDRTRQAIKFEAADGKQDYPNESAVVTSFPVANTRPVLPQQRPRPLSLAF